MSNYAIITDSASDLSANLVDELAVTVLPLSFTIENKTYLNYPDFREMSVSQFYSRLRNGEMASTAAINVYQYQEAIEPMLKQGLDVLILAFSSALSTTCQSAQIAAEELSEQYPDRKILVVDTLCASMGQGLLVYLAAKKQQAGASIDEVYHWATENRLSICHHFTVDDLGFLKRGGRVSATTAMVGTMLAIKPLLHVDNDGKLVSVSKARGRSHALKALVSQLIERKLPENDTIFISHGDCADEVNSLVTELRVQYPSARIEIAPIGPVIGAHAGPGTVALFYLANER